MTTNQKSWTQDAVLHLFGKTFDFHSEEKLRNFLLDVLQIHDEYICIEATQKLCDQKVEIKLKKKTFMAPYNKTMCSDVISYIEEVYSEYKENNDDDNETFH